MCAELIPLSDCVLKTDDRAYIAIHEGKPVSAQQFYKDVHDKAVCFHEQQQKFALFTQHAYPFCVSLFALLHRGKQVCIAGNNTLTTAKQLLNEGYQLVGDWNEDINELSDNPLPIELQPIDLEQTCIYLLTSGSTGQPKPIKKRLTQLQREINTLESNWGNQLAKAQVLSTVSHQHIYGLLFRVLWPLSAGRIFHSEIFVDPESLLKKSAKHASVWVASPAQLKRLDELTPWQQFKRLNMIFSSGGALDESVATNIYQRCGQKVTEIYGSTETGGIGWRRSIDENSWSLFSGIQLSQDQAEESYIRSPYLNREEKYRLDDRIQLTAEGKFMLLGRKDRIVKVEEKRLSLDALQQALNQCEEISQSTICINRTRRDTVCAALVLSEFGQQVLTDKGRPALINGIRKQLLRSFETIVLPRKWLFVSEIPMTTQGKIKNNQLDQLFALDSKRYPLIQHCEYQANQIVLNIKVHSDLVYFSGHFPSLAILPGIAQVAWADKFSQLFFDINLPFLRMEVIKFKKTIQPGDWVRMTLNWKATNQKLYFKFDSESDLHSSGRLVFGHQ